jgi:hypothetical protein
MSTFEGDDIYDAAMDDDPKSGEKPFSTLMREMNTVTPGKVLTSVAKRSSDSSSSNISHKKPPWGVTHVPGTAVPLVFLRMTLT